VNGALFTGNGQQVQLGRELGKGGEGAVFELVADSGAVAKLYNASSVPDSRKQEKLRYMASRADQRLLQYVAWPRETLHRTRGGPVVGFTMAKAIGRPIHSIYSPKQFRQEFPNHAWGFLVFVARNVAAAFEAVHQQGHLLGDVNQGNVLVQHDSKVMLIDADSFQVSVNGDLHLCGVGVSHFTPPELQGTTSFATNPRLVNHDNFGLALLLFHLLVGGRHPFSGVPLVTRAGASLESDISAFRYAYAADGTRRGFKPPPSSIPILSLPETIRNYFEAAFTERGSSGGRPTATQWIAALDSLRLALRKCTTCDAHQFSAHLSQCPWCSLESQGVVYFISIGPPSQAGGSNGFVLARALAAIEAIKPPQAEHVIRPAIGSLKPAPLPPSCDFASAIIATRVLIVLSALGCLLLFPIGCYSAVVVAVAGVLLAVAGSIGSEERAAERRRREMQRDTAKRTFDDLQSRYVQAAASAAFVAKKQELLRLKDEYEELSRREQSELSQLNSNAVERQRHHFLDRYHIESAVISGIGPAKKAALRSFGIETAADVTWSRVIAVHGFGEVKTSALVDWRKSIERRFVFNPAQAVTEADKAMVRSRFSTRRRSIEGVLSTGASDLQRIRTEGELRSKHLLAPLKHAADRLSQAEADLSVS
jgi:DNA-binding helix-hairpin-helix protein with protein kinase domain